VTGTSPKPLPRGDSFFTPGAGPLRRSVERRSAVLLVWLHQQRKALVGAIPLGLMVAVAVITGPWVLLPGALLLALVGWVSFLAWPVAGIGARILRLLVLAFLAAFVVDNLSR
jgi:hypothetical protein